MVKSDSRCVACVTATHSVQSMENEVCVQERGRGVDDESVAQVLTLRACGLSKELAVQEAGVVLGFGENSAWSLLHVRELKF